MVRRAYRQRSLVEVLLPDADKLGDSTLRQIDALLDDDVLVDRVAEALAQRHPQSQCRGRLGTPAANNLTWELLRNLREACQGSAPLLHGRDFDRAERRRRDTELAQRMATSATPTGRQRSDGGGSRPSAGT